MAAVPPLPQLQCVSDSSSPHPSPSLPQSSASSFHPPALSESAAGMASVSFNPHRLELLAAYQNVIENQNSIDWALYTYEDNSDILTLASSGGGGLHDLASRFENQKVMYGFCSVKEPHAMLARYVLINWVGEDVPDARKCACASHVAQIADFFQGVDVIVNASNVDDIDPVTIGQRLTNGSGRLSSPALQRLQLKDEGQTDPVGTNYQKTNAAVEMKRINREQFWEQAKKEEEERKEEERQKALEVRLRFEQERMEQERKEQEEREKRYQEREQQIEEHRKKLQDEEEEETKRLQSNSIFTGQREDEEAIEQKRTESEVEEAAAIIAQRTENPREFFKKQERAYSECGSTLQTPRTAFRSSSEAGPPCSPGPEPERRSSLGEEWTKTLTSENPMEDSVWTPQGLTEDVFMETKEDDVGFPEAPQLTGNEEEAVMELGEVDLISDAHPPPAQEATNLLDLWQNDEPQDSTWSDKNVITSQEEVNVEEKTFVETETCPSVPEDNLLNFELLPQPPATFCDMEAEEDPQSIIHIEGPHQMTLSYQHALQEASCHQPELTDSLLTNGETSQREGTQVTSSVTKDTASEGYFSQSQDEDFAQSEDLSAKAPLPVFYNKPPEIDITCWDSDPVMEEEEEEEEGGGFGESA
ncbi:drebrin isoform X6 [Xenopus laevis]|uniref:Drebrin n=1 Tax=Xenopus laevis TaxID=8355 RepID=A0A8J0UQH2_XENLA|nr:drebrin isoform X6 [Xenopus laevis]